MPAVRPGDRFATAAPDGSPDTTNDDEGLGYDWPWRDV
jgi:hypothetical protein